MKQQKIKYLSLIIIIVLVIIDQLSKIGIDRLLDLNESITIINNFIKLNYIHNYGAAWGIAQGYVIVINIITIIFLLYLPKYLGINKDSSSLQLISFAVLYGGILGNFIDRLILGYVRDFISLTFGNYQFPIFNISDVTIIIGFILVYYSYFFVKGGNKDA